MQPEEQHPLVFVYGTLKRGFGNHRVMQEAGGRFVCEATTTEQFPLVEQGLPYLLLRPGQGRRVEGEIFRVGTPEGWRRLDHLEGHPQFYHREVIAIEAADGDTYEAWAYFLTHEDESLAGLPPLRAYGRDGGLGVT